MYKSILTGNTIIRKEIRQHKNTHMRQHFSTYLIHIKKIFLLIDTKFFTVSMISHLFIGFVLMCPFLFYVSILSTTIILSTQPAPKVILSTQLCHSICSQSLNFTAFDRIENAVKSHLNATNPLKSKPFYTLDFRPLTSTRHPQWYYLFPTKLSLLPCRQYKSES